jgi:hypothetical protein
LVIATFDQAQGAIFLDKAEWDQPRHGRKPVVQDLTPLFRFEPIDSDKLARAAFPLAHALGQYDSYKDWRARIERFRKGGGQERQQGHLAIVSARGAVLAVLAFMIVEVKDAIAATGPADKRLVVTDIIGCRLPGFDPEEVLFLEKARLLATCGCSEVVRQG